MYIAQSEVRVYSHDAVYARANPATSPVGCFATLSRRALGSGLAGRLRWRAKSGEPSVGDGAGGGAFIGLEFDLCRSVVPGGDISGDSS